MYIPVHKIGSVEIWQCNSFSSWKVSYRKPSCVSIRVANFFYLRAGALWTVYNSLITMQNLFAVCHTMCGYVGLGALSLRASSQKCYRAEFSRFRSNSAKISEHWPTRNTSLPHLGYLAKFDHCWSVDKRESKINLWHHKDKSNYESISFYTKRVVY